MPESTHPSEGRESIGGSNADVALRRMFRDVLKARAALLSVLIGVPITHRELAVIQSGKYDKNPGAEGAAGALLGGGDVSMLKLPKAAPKLAHVLAAAKASANKLNAASSNGSASESNGEGSGTPSKTPGAGEAAQAGSAGESGSPDQAAQADGLTPAVAAVAWRIASYESTKLEELVALTLKAVRDRATEAARAAAAAQVTASAPAPGPAPAADKPADGSAADVQAAVVAAVAALKQQHEAELTAAVSAAKAGAAESASASTAAAVAQAVAAAEAKAQERLDAALASAKADGAASGAAPSPAAEPAGATVAGNDDELQALRVQLEDRTAQITALRAQIEGQAAHMAQLSSQLAGLQAGQAGRDAEIGRLQKQLRTAQDGLQAGQAGHAVDTSVAPTSGAGEPSTDLSALQAHRDSLQAQLVALQGQLAADSASHSSLVQSLNDEIKQLQGGIASRDAEIQKLQAEWALAQAQAAGLASPVLDLSPGGAQATDGPTDAPSTIAAAADADATALSDTLEIAEGDDEPAGQGSNGGGAEAGTAVASGQAVELQRQVEAAHNSLTAAQQEMSAVVAELQAAQGEVQTLRQQLASSEAAAKDSQAQWSASQASWTAREGELTSEIATLHGQLSEATEKLSAATASNDSFSEQLQSESSKRASLVAEAQTLDARAQAAESTVASLQTAVDGLRQQLRELEAAKAASDSKLRQTEKSLAVAEDKLSRGGETGVTFNLAPGMTIMPALSEMQERLAKALQTRAKYKQQLTTFQASITELQQRVHAAEDRTSTMASECNQLRVHISMVENENSQLRASAGDLGRTTGSSPLASTALSRGTGLRPVAVAPPVPGGRDASGRPSTAPAPGLAIATQALPGSPTNASSFGRDARLYAAALRHEERKRLKAETDKATRRAEQLAGELRGARRNIVELRHTITALETTREDLQMALSAADGRYTEMRRELQMARRGRQKLQDQLSGVLAGHGLGAAGYNGATAGSYGRPSSPSAADPDATSAGGPNGRIPVPVVGGDGASRPSSPSVGMVSPPSHTTASGARHGGRPGSAGAHGTHRPVATQALLGR